MREETWALLEGEFTQFPVMRSEPATSQEVAAAAQALCRSFHDDYAEFLRRYGGAMVGSYPIFGLRQAEVMGNDFWSVVDVTRRFQAEGWPGTQDWYIISMDGAGNPIGVSVDGKVWISDHDVGAASVIANSFEDFLLRRCLTNP
jgi:hypothetical protein